MHACTNSDLSFPEFRCLRRAILCNGRYLHIRLQECFEYVIERNSPLAVIHIIYAFFNRFTITTIIDSLLILMFNVLITLFPILFQAITEQDVYAQVLMRYPHLLRDDSVKGDGLYRRPNFKWVSIRLLRCFWFSAVILLGNRWVVQKSIILAEGRVSDHNIESLAIFMSLLLSTTLELCFHHNFYSYLTLSSFIFMIVVVILCLLFGNFSMMFGITLINVPRQIIVNPHFHLRWFLISVICVLPGMCYEVCKRLYWPSEADIYRYRSRIKGCVDLESSDAIEYLSNV